MKHCSTLNSLINKVCFFLLFSFSSVHSFSQNGSWLEKTPLPSDGRAAHIAFGIGDKGYVGLGLNFSVQGGSLEDFWEYDPAADSWTQKADYGGGKRGGASSFVIGDKGYVMTGTDEDAIKQNDLWEYDPGTNAWTQKADVPTDGRNYATAFAIDDKGYLSTGETVTTMTDDLWEYDPATDTWTQKADFPGGSRSTAISFSIDGFGYLGTGYGAGSLNDFYAYDPVSDTWTQKANAGTVKRNSAASFVIGERGYICSGQKTNGLAKDLIEYDPVSDTWASLAEIPTGRSVAAGFAAGGRGYFSGGFDIIFNQTKTLYEYTPDSAIATFAEQPWLSPSLEITPGIVGDNGIITISSSHQLSGSQLEVISMQGNIIYADHLASDRNEMTVQLPVQNLSRGIYLVVLKSKEGSIASGKIAVQ